MLSITHSAALIGIEAVLVPVEVDVSYKLPAIQVVGLPDSAVKESRERIRVAIGQCGFELPNRRITVNLAPADLRKEGAAFDLPIAVGILKSTGQIRGTRDEEYLLTGELSLSGAINPVSGSLSIGILAKKMGKKGVIVPRANLSEVSCVDGIEAIGVASLAEAAAFLEGEILRQSVSEQIEVPLPESRDLDLQQVRGQAHAKRALEIAAAGEHHLLLIGPPGCGKTMLAERLSTILPPFTLEEQLETSQVYSVMGLLKGKRSLMRERPFCSPHHTVTRAGLIGGGHGPKPGSASLAHHGILFLDEFGEFERSILDTLRQPMESGLIQISRARQVLSFPAKFLLVAAMNPCLCGHRLGGARDCRCSLSEIRQYRNRLSGPLLDRIDLRVELSPISVDELAGFSRGESSAEIAQRVSRAREILLNEEPGEEPFSRLPSSILSLLKRCSEKLKLSGRGYHSILRIARTIRALDAGGELREGDILEAIQYRSPVVEQLGESIY